MDSSFNNKVAVAMSGGVDSSVAAAILVGKYGRENVIGLTMKLFCYGETIREKNCCSLEAIEDARSVCQKLGIAHFVVDVEKEFETEVISDFILEYKQGRTPNPCIRCNQLIKFDYLLKKAREYGANFLATGHYARIEKVDLKYRLLKGNDKNKDQSYFLYNLNQAQLSSILFPLGELTKSKARIIAEEQGLATAQKAESQDICFIPGTVSEFLRARLKQKSGDIVDATGKVLGHHDGLAFYTVGQRKGLGGGFADPMFVIGLDLSKNTVVVGLESELFQKEFIVNNAIFTSGDVPSLPYRCKVKVRYQAEEAKCKIDQSRSNGFLVTLDKPQKAISPGQSAVFYLGEEVAGGGLIL
jgi:tRNA-specific 2-thiouridylase